MFTEVRYKTICSFPVNLSLLHTISITSASQSFFVLLQIGRHSSIFIINYDIRALISVFST